MNPSLLLILGLLGEPGWPLEAPLDQVLLVTVDGLRSDALVAAGRDRLPHLHRLMDGWSTLNARTDPDITLTLPNHSGIYTGARLRGPDGHGWSGNAVPEEGETLHSSAGRYLPSIFDHAHDRGIRTALLAGKTKFVLFATSWGPEHGRPDAIGEDDGRGKLDRYLRERDPGALTGIVLEELERPVRSLVAAHYRTPDDAGHDEGWNLDLDSAYMRQVAAVDAEMGRLLAAVDRLADEGRRIGIVLTADHGGGFPHRHHAGERPMWVNRIIPFTVWSPSFEGGGSLEERWPERWSDPGLLDPGADGPQPVRNLDAAAVCLELLGIDPAADPGGDSGRK
jgi:hypothetical protein